MKLKLVYYNMFRKAHEIETKTVYHFVDELGVNYTATIEAGRSDYERSRRWYELACGLLTANKQDMDLWIVLGQDPPALCYEVSPETTFKIELVQKNWTFVPPHIPSEKHRKDIHS